MALSNGTNKTKQKTVTISIFCGCPLHFHVCKNSSGADNDRDSARHMCTQVDAEKKQMRKIYEGEL